MRATHLVIAVTVMAGFGLAPAPGVAVAAAPAVSSLPCLPGIPLPGDHDGDGRPDELVDVVGLGDSHGWGRYRVTPGDGDPATWLYVGAGAKSADLNGDVCADAVSDASLLFGGPSGLDPATTVALSLPQAAGIDPDGIEQVVVSDGVAIRHDGISQVIVAGYFDDDGPVGNPFLDVFTLDAAGAAGVPQVITLTEVSSTKAVALAASRGTVALGLADLTVGGKVQAGGVVLFTPDAADHTTLERRATLTQNSPGVPGMAETGDGFGWTLDLRDGRLAVGVPLEDTGEAEDSGAVQPILWHEATATYTAYRRIKQGGNGVPGTDETTDWFGYQVVVTRGLTGAGFVRHRDRYEGDCRQGRQRRYRSRSRTSRRRPTAGSPRTHLASSGIRRRTTPSAAASVCCARPRPPTPSLIGAAR